MADVQSAFLTAAATTADQSVVAADTKGRSICVVGCYVFANGAGSVFFESGTATAITATFGPTAAAGMLIDMPQQDYGYGWFKTAANAALTVTTGGAGTVAVHVLYKLI